MKASVYSARAQGSTYAGANITQQLFTALTSKLMADWATANVTTSILGVIPSGKKSEPTMISCDASISEQSGITS